jgi:hypothetical protein
MRPKPSLLGDGRVAVQQIFNQVVRFAQQGMAAVFRFVELV